MTDVVVTFTAQHREGSFRCPGIGQQRLGFEVVTGIQLPDSKPLRFGRYIEANGSGKDIYTVSMQEATALHLSRFWHKHFSQGQGIFDCRSFAGYLAGWDETETFGKRRFFYGHAADPEHTAPMQPYVISEQQNGPSSHAMFGFDNSGMSFGILGPETPMVIAPSTTLMKAYGGAVLLAVERVEDDNVSPHDKPCPFTAFISKPNRNTYTEAATPAASDATVSIGSLAAHLSVVANLLKPAENPPINAIIQTENQITEATQGSNNTSGILGAIHSAASKLEAAAAAANNAHDQIQSYVQQIGAQLD
ncbi:MAG TPA: hypothetical protein VMR45_03435 [Patescibacteria group bacterium]|nr:hypothetical protein [Patescibacteria group bacterium]